jgi:hypothetical protein
MEAIRIHDARPNGVLAVDLLPVLAAVGPRALSSEWTVNDVRTAKGLEALMATGGGADELERLVQSRARITGSRLVDIMMDVQQVIWGEFKGFETAVSDDPWIIIIAFDSTWFEVQSSDRAMLDRLKARFSDVRAVG